MNNNQNKGRVHSKRRKKLFLLIFLLALAIALIILSVLFLRHSNDVANIKKDEEIRHELMDEKDKDQIKLKRLKKKYPDMVGWIEIKGTDFSYPVMQSGTGDHVKDDPEYYLNRNVQAAIAEM
ncbi:MAG: hypothetical protein K6F77_04435 [Lachnospiraceae bacterium]|nr:hypothetical protein [Lachnospiraceae bacterium]